MPNLYSIKTNNNIFIIEFKNALFEIPIKKGLIVDTNILLLYLIGSYDISYIKRFKRTESYTKEEYKFLCCFLENYCPNKKYISPHILTELSNLSLSVSSERLSEYFSYFIDILKKTSEIYINKNQIFKFKELSKFGVTDISILQTAKEYDFFVLTSDYKLSNYLFKNDIEVFNFRNISPYLWDL